jgi:hypothetical protein
VRQHDGHKKSTGGSIEEQTAHERTNLSARSTARRLRKTAASGGRTSKEQISPKEESDVMTREHFTFNAKPIPERYLVPFRI